MNGAAITGWAWRTPVGRTEGEVMGRLWAGERAAKGNGRFDAKRYACSLAATIDGEPGGRRHRRFVKRMGLHGIEVAEEAWAKAGKPAAQGRLGLYCGFGGLRAHWEDLMAALEGQLADGSADGAWGRGFHLLHPFWMLHHLSNNAHALLAIDLGAKGDGATYGGADAGAQALASAILALADGSIDAALVFAYDSLVEPETVLALASWGALARGGSAPPPYDPRADGVVPGEAAAAVVLERPDDAGGRAIARVTAAARADGETGWPRIATIADVLSQVARGDRVIDGASLAQPSIDRDERRAIAEVVSNDAALISIASATGNLGGATPIVQAIALSHALHRRTLPPIAGAIDVPPSPLTPVIEATTTDARSAVGLTAGAPGLAAAVRVEIDR